MATVSGYIWEIDFYRILRMYVPGTLAAPFTVDSAIQEATKALRRFER